MNKITASELSIHLFDLVDIIPGEIEVSRNIDVILPLIALEFLAEHNDHPFVINNESWKQISSRENQTKQMLSKYINELESRNSWLQGIFTTSTLMDIEEKSLQILLHRVQSLNLKRDRVEDDDPLGGTLARAVEAFIDRLARDEGKRGAIFTTPNSVKRLCAMLLVGTGAISTWYDGTIGLGSGLIESIRESQFSKDLITKVYGQELNKRTWALCRINMILHGIYGAEIANGDTLESPQFLNAQATHVMQYDRVFMNPPMGYVWRKKETARHDPYGRFHFGFPSVNKADMAFVQHAVASMNGTGKAVLLVAPGVLFRGGGDGVIRRNLVEEDLIEAVISLPANLHFHTTIPTVLLVLNKQKTWKRKIMMIKADEGFEKADRSHNRLRQEDITRIIETYRNGQEQDNFSRFIDFKEICRNEWNLSHTRYFEVLRIETALGEFPVSIQEYLHSSVPKIRMGDIANLSRGLPVTKDMLSDATSNSYRLINLSDVDENGEINWKELSGFRGASTTKLRSQELQFGDVLLSNRGFLIKIVVIPEGEDKIVASSNFLVIRLKAGFNPYYLKSFLGSPVGLHYIKSLHKGTTVMVLNQKDIEQILVPKLSQDEQQDLGEKFFHADLEMKAVIQEALLKRDAAYREIYRKMGASYI